MVHMQANATWSAIDQKPGNRDASPNGQDGPPSFVGLANPYTSTTRPHKPCCAVTSIHGGSNQLWIASTPAALLSA